MSARTAIRDWVAHEARSQFIWSIVGVVFSAIGGFLALYVTYQCLIFIGNWSFHSILTSQFSVRIFAWIMIGLLFVLYFTIDQRRLERIEFDSKESLRAARMGSIILGSSFLSLAAGPKSAITFVKIWLMILLMVPGLSALAVQLAYRAIQLSRIHAGDLSRALILALRAGQRIPLQQVFETSKSLSPPELKYQLKLIDGVIIRDDPPPGIYLTETLQKSLVDAITNEKEAE